MQIGLWEANQRFSRVMKAVKSGQEVVLTERGRPIAVIKPLASEAQADEDAVWRRFASAGLVRLPTNPGKMSSFRPRKIRGRTAAEIGFTRSGPLPGMI